VVKTDTAPLAATQVEVEAALTQAAEKYAMLCFNLTLLLLLLILVLDFMFVSNLCFVSFMFLCVDCFVYLLDASA
jgi:hypothetical protein